MDKAFVLNAKLTLCHSLPGRLPSNGSGGSASFLWFPHNLCIEQDILYCFRDKAIQATSSAMMVHTQDIRANWVCACCNQK